MESAVTYTVTVRGGAVYTLNEANGSSLQSAIELAKKPFPVRIEDDMVLSSQIVSITKNKKTQLDLPDEPALAERAYTRCRGQYSIQCEINNIAKSEHPHDWSKYIKDDEWRDQIRARLLESTYEWCDYKPGKCICEAGYLSSKSRH